MTMRALIVRAAIAALALVVLAPAGASAAPPPLLSQFCEAGAGAGQCRIPRGIATDPANGNVYVVDQGNSRINQFSPWGVFAKAWGGGVASGGAVGTGDLSTGSKKVTSVLATKKTFIIGQVLAGDGIAPGTKIADVGVGTLTLSQAATATGSGVALTAPEGATNVPTNERQTVTIGGAPSGGSFTLTLAAGFVEGNIAAGSNQLTATANASGVFHVGDTSGSISFPPGTTITAIDAITGTLAFSANATSTDNVGLTSDETTAPIPFDAAAAAVASALEALPAVGSDNVEVSGPAGGPYEVEFKGPLLADTDVRQLSASAAGLIPSGTVAVSTTSEGAGAPEVCSDPECMKGTVGSGPGQFGGLGPQGISVDSAGAVYVVDLSNRRVQKYDPEGHLLLSFGGPGSADGQFGDWPTFDGSFIAVGPGDKVYVGDEGRIQRFDTAGNYVESIPLPGETVQSLAVDPNSGNLYVSLCNLSSFCNPTAESGSKPYVLKLSPAGTTLATLEVDDPRALATDAAGNLYVVDGRKEIGGIELEVRKFTAAAGEVPSFTFADGFNLSTGIAASSACGIEGADLFLGNASGSDSYVRVYGPPPDVTLCPPPAVPPSITEQYAVSVDTTGATLKAVINPNFWPDTTYHVQYGTGKCSEGGCEALQPAPPGSKLTTETTNLKVTTAGVFLGDLQPGTTYHYRFVAQSSGGGPVRGVGGELGNDGAEGTFTTFAPVPAPRTDCPNQAFRSGASAPLPDCRAYELVSPLEKNGGDADVLEGNYLAGLNKRVRARLDQVRPDGEQLTYSTFRAFEETASAPWSSQYLADRDPQAGWQSRSINPPRGNLLLNTETNTEVMFKAFSEDLCSGWLVQETDLALVEGAPPLTPNLYRRELCGAQGYELLTSVAPTGARADDELGASFYYPMVQGSTPDGAHSLMRADTPLTPDASTKEIFQLYETSEGPLPGEKAELRLVSVLPDGKPAGTHSSLGTPAGENAEFRSDSVHNAVAADGSRVFWTASTATSKEDPPPEGRRLQPGNLYLRANPLAPQSANGKCEELGKACTLAIAGPDAEFWTADPGGSRAIYQIGAVLFEAQIEAKGKKLVSTSTQIAAGVIGVMGASEDADRVYLTSTNALAAGAVAGKPNLYLYEQGAGFKLVAAALSSLDSSHFDDPSLDNIKPVIRKARVSADGLHAVFLSHAPLTGYDNTDVQSGQPDAEVFLYDAGANEGAGNLVCVACNPSGARPEGRLLGRREDSIDTPIWAAAQIPGWETQQYASRLLSPDGSYLFFESFDALVPADTNGARDVYQWQQASGPAACEQLGAALYVPASGGCLSLISSGKSPADSGLIDASADGRDVFFSTGASLIGADPGLTDIYDARIGGGFPTPVAPAACEGEACQGPASPPNDPTPASAAFQGAGNVKPEGRPRKPKPCAKGKVRRKGRCVAKKGRKGKSRPQRHRSG